MQIVNPKSEQEAKRAAQPKPLPPGWRHARIIEAAEKEDKNEKDMIELRLLTKDQDGNERSLRTWLTTHERGALLMRHAAAAVGALEKYESGTEILPSDFAGHHVRIKLATVKKRNQKPYSEITDFAALSSETAA